MSVDAVGEMLLVEPERAGKETHHLGRKPPHFTPILQEGVAPALGCLGPEVGREMVAAAGGGLVGPGVRRRLGPDREGLIQIGRRGLAECGGQCRLALADTATDDVGRGLRHAHPFRRLAPEEFL